MSEEKEGFLHVFMRLFCDHNHLRKKLRILNCGWVMKQRAGRWCHPTLVEHNSAGSLDGDFGKWGAMSVE